MDIGITAVPWFDNYPQFLGSDLRNQINFPPNQVVVLRNLPCRKFFFVLVGDPSFSICAVEDTNTVDQPLLGHVVASFHYVHFLDFMEVVVRECNLP
jgi:hypothetical protein